MLHSTARSVLTASLHRPATRFISTQLKNQVRNWSHGANVTTSPEHGVSDDFPYPGYKPISILQQGVLAVGSAITCALDPRRQDLVAAVGETTSGPVLGALRDRLLSTAEGRSILRRRPVISSKILGGFERLRALPENTFGRHCVRFWDEERVSPDTRTPVQFVSCPELSYVLLRHRQTHDFAHALTGTPTTVCGEVALKFFEFAQAGLPVSFLASIAAPIMLKPADRSLLIDKYIPWALSSGSSSKLIMAVELENIMEMDLEEVRKSLNITVAPDFEKTSQNKVMFTYNKPFRKGS